MTGKGIVARVVCRHCHDGASAVTGQHIIAYPYGNLLACHGIHGIRAGEYAADLLIYLALAFGLMTYFAQIFLHSLFAVGSRYLSHIIAFRSQYHESNAENRVGACGEDFKLQVVSAGNGKSHLGAFAAANPVALRLFEAVGPVQLLQAVEQTLCVC